MTIFQDRRRREIPEDLPVAIGEVPNDPEEEAPPRAVSDPRPIPDVFMREECSAGRSRVLVVKDFKVLRNDLWESDWEVRVSDAGLRLEGTAQGRRRNWFDAFLNLMGMRRK